tara:strand:- start:592 stop:771 length:180 start_codon:yes stop_codon:yes gene_type:complete
MEDCVMPDTTTPYVTNKEFMEHDRAFRRACVDAKIEPTKRQASKYRRKEGRAYRTMLLK